MKLTKEHLKIAVVFALIYLVIWYLGTRRVNRVLPPIDDHIADGGVIDDFAGDEWTGDIDDGGLTFDDGGLTIDYGENDGEQEDNEGFTP
jgi:hypothetical protein